MLGGIGRTPAQLVVTILEESRIGQGFRSCLGIIHLARSMAPTVSKRPPLGIMRRTFSYNSVKSILAHNLDQAPLPGRRTASR